MSCELNGLRQRRAVIVPPASAGFHAEVVRKDSRSSSSTARAVADWTFSSGAHDEIPSHPGTPPTAPPPGTRTPQPQNEAIHTASSIGALFETILNHFPDPYTSRASGRGVM